MKVLIGTKNPGKILGAKNALENYFQDVEVVGISSPSEVSEQPIGEETFLGAKNRVKNLVKYSKENNIDADMFMAVESGIFNDLGFWAVTNVAVIRDKKGNESVGTSASFPIPNKYLSDIKEIGLGDVMDRIFKENNLHNGTGGIGILTHEKITRIDLNTQAFTMALTQFINGKAWSDENVEEIEK